MKKISALNPKKLETTLNTMATESLLFDNDHLSIIEKCRAFDIEIKMIRDQLNAIIIDHIDDQTAMKLVNDIILLSDKNNQLKKSYQELFHSAILNKSNRNWLHLEMGARKSKGYDVEIFEHQLRWRVGSSTEKRTYCDKLMIANPVFYGFFIQEPVASQEIILEFERVKMLIWSISFSIRSRYFEICNLYKNHQEIKQLQSYYHSLKGINNG